MSLIEGPVNESGALFGYINYVKQNGVSDPDMHWEVVWDMLNFFRKRGTLGNDPNAMGSTEY